MAMQDADYGVALFGSTQRVLKAEQALKAAGMMTKLIPVPRHISSDCGVCLRFLWKDRPRVEDTLISHGVELDRILPLEKRKKGGDDA